MLAPRILATLLCLRASFVLAGLETSANTTAFLQHRQKRFLIFQNSGTVKISMGVNAPIPFQDPISWRSVTISNNVQGGQYPLPTEPLYAWDKWEQTFARSMKNVHDQYTRFGECRQDDSRLFVYTLLESYMARQRVNGRACLLRSICENAQVHHHVGVFAEILNIVLTPGKETLHPVYKEAHLAGKSGVDCLQLYSECAKGSSLLDSYLDDF